MTKTDVRFDSLDPKQFEPIVVTLIISDAYVSMALPFEYRYSTYIRPHDLLSRPVRIPMNWIGCPHVSDS